MPHAELASAKGCKPEPSGGTETADTAEAQGAAKRYLPFSAGVSSCLTLFSSCCLHHAGAASIDTTQVMWRWSFVMCESLLSGCTDL